MTGEGIERVNDYAIFIAVGLFAAYLLMRPFLLSVRQSIGRRRFAQRSAASQAGYVVAVLIVVLFFAFSATTNVVSRYDISEHTLNQLAQHGVIEQQTLFEFLARKRERAHEGYKVNGLVGLTESRSLVRGGNISDLFSIGRFNRGEN